jgi:hypothetical protein
MVCPSAENIPVSGSGNPITIGFTSAGGAVVDGSEGAQAPIKGRAANTKTKQMLPHSTNNFNFLPII